MKINAKKRIMAIQQRKRKKTGTKRKKSLSNAAAPYFSKTNVLSTVVIEQLSKIFKQKLVPEKPGNTFQRDIPFPKIFQAAV